MSKFLLDPGHGGSDPGALGLKSHEADINLMLTKIIGRILTEQHQTVIHSRLTDKALTLKQRADISNREHCDVFISIHCNSFNKVSHGVETFSYPNSKEGLKLSKIVQDGLVKVTGLTDRGSKTANFGVLRMTNAPAILIETAFISNIKEENLLLSESFREKVAESIVRSLFKYLGIKYIDKVVVVKPVDKNNNAKTFYRVVTGSFEDESNANDRIAELKKAGFDSFIALN